MRPQRGRLGHVFLQPAVGLVDAAVEHQFGGPHFQPFGRELRKQGDRVVVQLPPADRVEIAEEVDHFGVPTPPQVSGQRDALFVEGFRRESGGHGCLHLLIRKRFNLAHKEPPFRCADYCRIDRKAITSIAYPTQIGRKYKPRKPWRGNIFSVRS